MSSGPHPPGADGRERVGRILVIDDSPDGRHATRLVLERAGFNVQEASTLAAGRAAALSGHPDLILLDVHLPDGNGIDLAHQLRDDERTAAVPIVQTSAVHRRPADQVHGLGSGADVYLVHPIEPSVLVATIRSLLRSRRAEQHARRAATTMKAVQTLTAALNGAIHEHQVIEAVHLHGTAATGAALVNIRLPVSTPEHGLAGAGAIRDVCRSVQEVVLRHPDLAADFISGGHHSLIVNPLQDQADLPIGRIELYFTSDAAIDPDTETSSDMLAAVTAQSLQRCRLYDAARQATAHSDNLRQRAEALQALGMRLAVAHTPQDMAIAIADTAPPIVNADHTQLALLDQDRRVLVMHHGSTLDPEVQRDWPEAPLDAPIPIADVIRTGDPLRFSTAKDLSTAYPAVKDAVAQSGFQTVATVPITTSEGSRRGTLTMAWAAPDQADDQVLESMHQVADRCAAALERADRSQQAERLALREHEVATRLQAALLPDTLAGADRLPVHVHYIPSDEQLLVGGDWYETALLPDGRLAMAVGDIVGHGLPAAATMGRLRTAFAALAPRCADPVELLVQLDIFAATITQAEASTAVIAFLDPLDGSLDYIAAGHPPPLAVPAEGASYYLDGGRSWPLAIHTNRTRPAAARTTLTPGTTLALYTDGLIERRSENIHDSLQRLLAAADTLIGTKDDLSRLLTDTLLTHRPPRDDVVVLTAELPAIVTKVHRPAQPAELAPLRQHLRNFLDEHHVHTEQQHAILTATGEACANAIEHAYRGSTAADVEVLLALHRHGALQVRVQDHGTWKTPTPTPHRGRGIPIMARTADRYERHTADHGTRVTLTFLLRPP